MPEIVHKDEDELHCMGRKKVLEQLRKTQVMKYDSSFAKQFASHNMYFSQQLEYNAVYWSFACLSVCWIPMQ